MESIWYIHGWSAAGIDNLGTLSSDNLPRLEPTCNEENTYVFLES